MNCYLEQLCIQSNSVDITDTFMESVSAHGGLVHVVLQGKSVTGDGVTALIENSPNLVTCHISAYHICASALASAGVYLNLTDFKMTLKKIFCNRKLFSFGIYYLAMVPHDSLNVYNTELTSIWYKWSDNRKLF